MNPIASLIGTQPPEVEHFFAVDVEALKDQLSELDAEIDPTAVARSNDSYHRRILEVWQASQAACRRLESDCEDPETVLAAQQRFRYETDPWFSRSWIAHRARTKPSGFPGDYDMLLKLYAMATPARGIGAYLDLCIQDLPLARAVRARLSAAREFLIREIAARTTNVRVLNIACGPCQEYRDWPVLGYGRQVEVVAMDSDPNALAYIEASVGQQPSANTTLEAVRYNALRTRSAAATIRKFGKFDILYSVGLCDYLPDEHLVSMLAAWRDTLNDGGVLYVAFKDSNQYDKTPYQWHLDWHFFQRTPEDVMSLYDRAGFDVSNIKTTRDNTGIIINMIDRQPETRRVDSPHGILPPHSAGAADVNLTEDGRTA